MFLTIVLYALFASLFGLSKGTLSYSEPFFLIGSRMLFAGLLLLAHQFFYNRKAFQIKLSHVKSLLLLSFFVSTLPMQPKFGASSIWFPQKHV